MALRLRGQAVILVDAKDLSVLQRQMARYAAATGKSMEDVLAKEGREMAFQLHKELSKFSPKPMDLLQAAKARNWRMGRASNQMTRSVAGWVSKKAHDRAEELLAGQKSDYFRVRTTGSGSLIVRRVRFSQRATGGKDTVKMRRVLTGGRRNNRYSRGALRARDVARHELSAALKANSDIKRLNLGSLAASIELGYRQRAGMGHTMALQWLPRVYARRSSALVKRGPLIVNARNGYEMGRVSFGSDSSGNLNSITLTGRVPGTAAVMQRRNVLPTVFSALVADREIGIQKAFARAKSTSFTRA